MTVKIYRARAMKKLAARTTAELVRKIRALQFGCELRGR
jgi:DNA-binding CsgD family transcriptional regulator